MTTEELLKPRYKVIADWPGNIRLEVGKVITQPDYDNNFTGKLWCKQNDDYPHLFKKLEWWEEREEKEMPKYLLDKRDNDVLMIISPYTDSADKYVRSKSNKCCGWVSLYDTVPATKEEYEKQSKL